jgi:hypothetical protein
MLQRRVMHSNLWITFGLGLWTTGVGWEIGERKMRKWWRVHFRGTISN